MHRWSKEAALAGTLLEAPRHALVGRQECCQIDPNLCVSLNLLGLLQPLIGVQ